MGPPVNRKGLVLGVTGPGVVAPEADTVPHRTEEPGLSDDLTGTDL
jgi:hypothetical protein